MQRINPLSFAMALTTALALTGCGSAMGVPRAARSAEPVDRSIARYLDRTLPNGPGGTVVAARGAELAHCKGFGLADRTSGSPASCDTVYDVMSITKQFTAAAIMKLEMMGRLRTTDRIGTVLGPVPADKRGITLHHLLTHKAGLAEGLGDDYEPVSRDGMLGRALKSKLVSRPGTEFHYSNTGFSVLAAIVEKVSGTSYERFLAKHLFAPAGMTQTGYVLPKFSRAQVAVEYDEEGTSQGRPLDHPWAADGPYWYLRGNGGMLSTGRDMFRWHRALLGDTILSADVKARMFEPHARIPGTEAAYGYGWGVLHTKDGRVAWHNGGNDWSFASYSRILRDGTMVFWVTNQASQADQWNLEDRELEMNQALADHARDTD
ncbi:CubicO group peptidase, beta-lactamase class C family [Actinomadura madurae]|uniref:CubicO group peptidase, beta-lactamase class C family n=1 Tax=Actinomadura madurae TaxID=1993 RepID=A0A1I4Y2I5_9ACTN|nr:serine hydrolase domain-containing protein [Actinomadura madurae]SFN32294.1 CubicO group peptidase, beta-lactamase class C family [Actinomadura madurae]